jgi:hypothetical protein
MTTYLPYHRYPNLDSYPIFFRGIPADLLDCFWAIDYEKSQYSGKAVWQVAFFSGHKLRDGYRQVTFLEKMNPLNSGAWFIALLLRKQLG